MKREVLPKNWSWVCKACLQESLITTDVIRAIKDGEKHMRENKDKSCVTSVRKHDLDHHYGVR